MPYATKGMAAEPAMESREGRLRGAPGAASRAAGEGIDVLDYRTL